MKEKRKLSEIQTENNNHNNNKNKNKHTEKKFKTTKNSDIKSDPSNINKQQQQQKQEQKTVVKVTTPPKQTNKTNTATSVNDQLTTSVPIRVYADGIYDLFHFGHARSLEQAKRLFPNTHLIVGVCNDEITHKLKGKTVMNGDERAESLRHCKWVDEVVPNAPWIVTQEFIDQHNIDFVAHGEDLCLDKDGNDIYQFVKDQGKFKTIKRTDGISTSDIILRIVKDYDSYVKRNLARGYTGKQMNVSLFKENSLKVEEKIEKLKTTLKDRIDQFKIWSDQTEFNIINFLQKFSKRVPESLENGSAKDSLASYLDLNEDPLSPDTLHILNQSIENIEEDIQFDQDN